MNISFNSGMLSNGFKVKRQKVGVGTLIFLMLFGGVFVGAGYFTLDSLKIDPSWVRISGEVVSLSSRTSQRSTTYAPVVKYSVNGQEYRTTSSLSSSSIPNIGEKLEVAYNPSQPNQAKIVESTNTTWWLWAFPAVGLAIMVIALVTFIKSLKRSNTIKNLLQTGQKLQGVLTNIQATTVQNGNSSYKIIVSATDNTGVVQNYVSDSLNGVAGLAMADFQNNPILIDVYVDLINPQNYYVDISDIPNLTPQRISELIQAASQGMQPHTVFNPQQDTSPVENTQIPMPRP